jgi:hypothetical protein
VVVVVVEATMVREPVLGVLEVVVLADVDWGPTSWQRSEPPILAEVAVAQAKPVAILEERVDQG